MFKLVHKLTYLKKKFKGKANILSCTLPHLRGTAAVSSICEGERKKDTRGLVGPSSCFIEKPMREENLLRKVSMVSMENFLLSATLGEGFVRMQKEKLWNHLPGTWGLWRWEIFFHPDKTWGNWETDPPQASLLTWRYAFPESFIRCWWERMNSINSHWKYYLISTGIPFHRRLTDYYSSSSGHLCNPTTPKPTTEGWTGKATLPLFNCSSLWQV